VTVLIDTSALFALVDQRDDRHAEIIDALHRHRDEEIAVTNYVAVETLSLAHRRLGMDAVRGLQRTAMTSLPMLWTTAIEHTHAVEAFLDSGRSLSLVDCSTMATMRARNIESIIAFDDDFRRAGFRVIP
jgi:predicted nucleic acid-binding protein